MTVTIAPAHTASLARLGHALSDDTRARVLLALRETPALPSELADALGVSRQKLSNHLACLRGCGLVSAEREGRTVRYRLSDPLLAEALEDLLRLTRVLDPECCTGEACACR